MRAIDRRSCQAGRAVLSALSGLIKPMIFLVLLLWSRRAEASTPCCLPLQGQHYVYQGLLLSLTALLVGGCVKARTTAAGSGSEFSSRTFFVATNGNDQWSGRLASPSRRQTHGPFATLPRALGAVRQRMQTEPENPGNILLRDGTYFLSVPLRLYPEDSGLRISAYHDEKPILS